MASDGDMIEEVPDDSSPAQRVRSHPMMLLAIVFIIYIALVFLGNGITQLVQQKIHRGRPIPWTYNILYGSMLVAGLIIFTSIFDIPVLWIISNLVV